MSQALLNLIRCSLFGCMSQALLNPICCSLFGFMSQVLLNPFCCSLFGCMSQVLLNPIRCIVYLVCLSHASFVKPSPQVCLHFVYYPQESTGATWAGLRGERSTRNHTRNGPPMVSNICNSSICFLLTFLTFLNKSGYGSHLKWCLQYST